MKWTLGYVNSVEEDLVKVTYSHVDKFREFKTSEIFKINEIVLVCIENKEFDDFEYDEITGLSHFDENIRYEMIYSYQSALLHIAKDDYLSREFLYRLKRNYSNFLIEKYIDNILDSGKINFLVEYVNSINIKQLIEERKVVINEMTDKYGDYKGYKVECTDFKDIYLNELLHFYGSYSPWCVNNTPKINPYESYSDAVSRVERETAENAIKLYSKRIHMMKLLNECIAIKQEYLKEKEEIYKVANEYMNYPLL